MEPFAVQDVTVVARDRIVYQGVEYVADDREIVPGSSAGNWLTGEPPAPIADRHPVWRSLDGRRTLEYTAQSWAPHIPPPAFVAIQWDRVAGGNEPYPDIYAHTGCAEATVEARIATIERHIARNRAFAETGR